MRDEKGRFIKGCQINLGRKKTKEQILAMSKRMIGKPSPRKGVVVSDESREKMRNAKLGKKLSEEHKKKMSLAMKGKIPKNIKLIAGWNKGIGLPTPLNKSIRNSSKYKIWRESIFIRDNFTCIFCGKIGCKLEADHIIPFSAIINKLRFEQGVDNLYEKAMNYELLWDINNGRTLCLECHKKTDTFAGKSKKNYEFI